MCPILCRVSLTDPQTVSPDRSRDDNIIMATGQHYSLGDCPSTLSYAASYRYLGQTIYVFTQRLASSSNPPPPAAPRDRGQHLYSRHGEAGTNELAMSESLSSLINFPGGLVPFR